ncbi:uncharacterized protein LOC116346772 [Contarinia nasturtii]|uniref:uncharacterized protein LOC116346772 n=1 Tax=Contarinia nasturtii TaxID=265458 RepID=UPI0012D47765|nr:uncharacterized protein LOC116346772 [Contarinia nasturtii]
MKCCLIVVNILCCAVSFTVAVDLTNVEITEELITTGATCLLHNTVSTPVNALVTSAISKAAVEGILLYNQTHNLEIAMRLAAECAFESAVNFANSALCATSTGLDIVTDVCCHGVKPHEAIMERTNVDRVARRILNHPKGKTARNVIEKTNIIITWKYGPIPGYIATAITQATAEGVKKYNRSGSAMEATEAAATHAFKSVAKVFKLIFGLTKSGVGLSFDLLEGKGARRSFRRRTGEALGAILD